MEMSDALLKTVQEIQETVRAKGLQVYYGYLAEETSVPSVHWNSENGGEWGRFLDCAVELGAKVVYVNWAPFDQFQIDEVISALRSDGSELPGNGEDSESLAQIRAFQSKVGLTCVVDLAFVANGILHLYQETAEWFDEFGEVAGEEGDEEEENGQELPIAGINEWATKLASDPKYATSKNREYLLERIAGGEFAHLPLYRVLRRAEAIYETDFKEGAEERLAAEVMRLRCEGLNQNAIALKLGISRDRVSAIVSAFLRGRDGSQR
jgi:hypothetical protein